MNATGEACGGAGPARPPVSGPPRWRSRGEMVEPASVGGRLEREGGPARARETGHRTLYGGAERGFPDASQILILTVRIKKGKRLKVPY